MYCLRKSRLLNSCPMSRILIRSCKIFSCGLDFSRILIRQYSFIPIRLFYRDIVFLTSFNFDLTWSPISFTEKLPLPEFHLLAFQSHSPFLGGRGMRFVRSLSSCAGVDKTSIRLHLSAKHSSAVQVGMEVTILLNPGLLHCINLLFSF